MTLQGLGEPELGENSSFFADPSRSLSRVAHLQILSHFGVPMGATLAPFGHNFAIRNRMDFQTLFFAGGVDPKLPAVRRLASQWGVRGEPP